jgi:hypothetical protein
MGSGFAGLSGYVKSAVSGRPGANNRVHDSGADLVGWNALSQGAMSLAGEVAQLLINRLTRQARAITPLFRRARLSGLSEHPRQGTIVLTSLFQIISRPFLGSARTLAHRFLAAFAIFALPASERTRFSCTQFGCDPECQGQGRGAAAMSTFIILNQEQSAQRPSVPFAYFTSTFVRIQGWMQHWKRCSPFESPVS